MAEFDKDTLRAMQIIYRALQTLEGGMGKLAEATGNNGVSQKNSIQWELHALRNLDQRIWPQRDG